jgi:hypothetical protein
MPHPAVVLFLAAAAAAEPAYFRIELSPSGSQVSIGEPTARGSMVVFRAYPDGKLLSVRRSTVRGYSRITTQEAAGPPPASVRSIGNLPMQGGGATTATMSGAAKSAPAAASARGPRIVPTTDGLAITTAPAPK